LFEPVGPKKAKAEYSIIEMCDVKPVPDGWTIWDIVTVDRGDITLQEFIDSFPAVHHGCQITFANFRHHKPPNTVIERPLYVRIPFTPELLKAAGENKDKKLSQLYLEFYGEMPPSKRKYFLIDASVDDAEGNTATIPPIKVIFAK